MLVGGWGEGAGLSVANRGSMQAEDCERAKRVYFNKDGSLGVGKYLNYN